MPATATDRCGWKNSSRSSDSPDVSFISLQKTLGPNNSRRQRVGFLCSTWEAAWIWGRMRLLTPRRSNVAA